ncbi:MAG TPA: hypothetical protein VK687_02900 [Bryobacteraceae bacterium]|nr:hypothetical protein [Bryobacteraceae bacterium]
MLYKTLKVFPQKVANASRSEDRIMKRPFLFFSALCVLQFAAPLVQAQLAAQLNPCSSLSNN